MKNREIIGGFKSMNDGLTSVAESYKIEPCNCKALINTSYFEKIEVFDTINGKSESVAQDSINDNFLLVNIVKDTLDFFKVKLYYSMSGDSVVGWIKKASYIVTTLRAQEKSLSLYKAPSFVSEFKKVLGTDVWGDIFLQVQKCKGSWVYVSYFQDSLSAEGWLSPINQCNNPYTTCN